MECPICLVEMSTKTLKLNCGHEFHEYCIEKWFKKSKTCPTCRFRGNKLIKQTICCWWTRVTEYEIEILDQNLD